MLRIILVAYITASHPTRGAWIEMVYPVGHKGPVGSHPTRGAWIEIGVFGSIVNNLASHPTRGAWIEINSTYTINVNVARRTPPGVRGLKSRSLILFLAFYRVAPHPGCVD